MADDWIKRFQRFSMTIDEGDDESFEAWKNLL